MRAGEQPQCGVRPSDNGIDRSMCGIRVGHATDYSCARAAHSDLGYGDLGFTGHPTTLTPQLNMLARQGKRLTTWYSAYVAALHHVLERTCLGVLLISQCHLHTHTFTVASALDLPAHLSHPCMVMHMCIHALSKRRYPVCTSSRTAVMTGRQPPRVGMPGVINSLSAAGLPLSERTLADHLGSKGYKSLAIGAPLPYRNEKACVAWVKRTFDDDIPAHVHPLCTRILRCRIFLRCHPAVSKTQVENS
jgi:hypothetical protein